MTHLARIKFLQNGLSESVIVVGGGVYREAAHTHTNTHACTHAHTHKPHNVVMIKLKYFKHGKLSEMALNEYYVRVGSGFETVSGSSCEGSRAVSVTRRTS